MSKLEDLVPSLELCKKIPEGCFADSALVWIGGKRCPKLDIVPRENLLPGQLDFVKKGYWFMFPSPTLAEIMIAIEDLGYSFPTCYRQANTWQVDCEEDGEEPNPFPKLYDAEDRTNPATAALKLWLDLEKVDHE